MEGRVTCGLWVVVLLLGCGRLSAFNLDEENVQRKDGDKGSLFGFSLAMHWQLAPENKRMLLVGAPRAKKWRNQKSEVTGGLYNCDMTSSSTSCPRVVFDDNEDLARESKATQWMGVSVNSQGPGGKIVTCAHRYQVRANVGKNLESRDIIGRCYVLSQSLTIDSSTGDEGGSWHFCANRNRGHEMFGSCQQGMSATFDKDYHYLIFGAPGAYNWKGVVRLEQKNDSLLDIGIYDDGPFEAGDEKEKDPTLYDVPDNSYLGFSLDSGMGLTKKDQLTVVAGAPRAYFSGAVVLLKKDTANGLKDELTLKGEGLASSFGYDLTVLDLNNDGWLDIVVGAPQYFEKDKTIGGAVYVYVNKAGKLGEVTPIKIEGPQDSMFGQAVENLGDINQDGFHDFAVAAPYANDEAGAVYIYHGAAKDLSFKKESQLLSGPPGVKMFGYSLAGNMDLDMNTYPDLAVGSLSDAVFVFKARPVINIAKEVSFSPKEIDLTKKNCGSHVCLEVVACFTYTANPKDYAPSLTVEYILEADADHMQKGLKPRATFTEASENAYQSKGTVIMDTKGKKKCIKRQLKLQENIQDKLNGITVEVSANIQGGKRKRRQSSPQILPVLDPNEILPDMSQVHFLKEGCGTDNVCQSNLQVTHRYGHKPTGGPFTPLELVGGLPEITLSDQKDIALEVTVSNKNGDDAYEAAVTTSFPPFLTYSTFSAAPELQISCTANANGSQPKCDLGNPFRSNSESIFYIILGTSGFPITTTELEIDLQLETTSEQKIVPVKAKAKVVIMLDLSLSGQARPSQVFFSGKAKGESAMKKESDVGSAIAHQFRILNLGKSLKDFVTASLHIQWPQETADKKWLLYLTNITSTGVDRIECSPKTAINTRDLELHNNRKRRAAENTQGREEGTLSRLLDKKSKILSCDDGAHCVTITCPLRGLDSNAVITLNSRLWNSTFIEDFPKLHHVTVIVKASLHINNTEKIVLKSQTTEVRLTVFPERVEAQSGGVPWWIIVLSVLFGLLLLALLAFLLWKCGFFKRAKYEDKVPSYNAVRIKREERAINPKNGNWENLEKKPWMTTWHDKEHYS